MFFSEQSKQFIHGSELCTFRDPSVDADASDAVQFVSFQVSSSPNDENTTRNDIKVGQFVWRGVLQIPLSKNLLLTKMERITISQMVKQC